MPTPLSIGGAVNPSKTKSLSYSEIVVLVTFVPFDSLGKLSNELELPVSANS